MSETNDNPLINPTDKPIDLYRPVVKMRMAHGVPGISSVTIKRTDGKWTHKRQGKRCTCGWETPPGGYIYSEWLQHLIEILEAHK